VADMASLGDEIDGAVLAVPTHLHRPLGEVLLERAIPVLVEKPLSRDPANAEALIAAAEASQTILMVGHVERFNPAVLELDQLIQDPIHIEATRISPHTPRIDDGVILDLMIHDLDIVASLVGAPLADIQAMASCVRSESEDLAVAILRFEDGATATLTASRIGQEKIRRMAITEASSYVVADLIRQDVTVHRIEEVGFTSERAGYRQRGVIEIPYLLHRGEPLFLELEHFVQCIQTRSMPRISGEGGLRALQMAYAVMRAAGLPVNV